MSLVYNVLHEMLLPEKFEAVDEMSPEELDNIVRHHESCSQKRGGQ